MQPAEVTSMSLLGHHLVVATTMRHILVYDIRKMSEAEQSTETHVRFQTRSISCFPDGTGTLTKSTRVLFPQNSASLTLKGLMRTL